MSDQEKEQAKAREERRMKVRAAAVRRAEQLSASERRRFERESEASAAQTRLISERRLA